MRDFTTLMLIPQNQKKIRSLKVPSFYIKIASLLGVLVLVITAVFLFDYWKMLQNVYRNHYLTQENKQLKEQIQIFQMKMNLLKDQMERIHVFEKKLRIISGLDQKSLDYPYFEKMSGEQNQQTSIDYQENLREQFQSQLNLQTQENRSEYERLKSHYQRKVLSSLGLKDNYQFTKYFTPMANQGLKLSEEFASFDFSFQQLKKQSQVLEEDLNKLDQFLLDRESIMRSTPIVMPTNGWITSFYGPRKSPYSGKLRMHEGIDIGAPYNAPITAPADGIVLFAGRKPGFGKHVHIDHGYGIETIYAHSSQVLVEKGDKISRGMRIATIGSSGQSTGPHIHYEVRINGIPVDPYYFILEN